MRKIKVVVLLVQQLQHGFTKNAKVSPNLTVAHLRNELYRVVPMSHQCDITGSKFGRVFIALLTCQNTNLLNAFHCEQNIVCSSD